jgi:hypothetical protein
MGFWAMVLLLCPLSTLQWEILLVGYQLRPLLSQSCQWCQWENKMVILTHQMQIHMLPMHLTHLLHLLAITHHLTHLLNLSLTH